MKKILKLNGNIITFLVIVLLLIIYKLMDNLPAIGDFFAMLYNAVKPFVTAFVLAYILNMPCRSIEALLMKSKIKKLKKHKRGISIILVYILAVIVITVFVRTIAPEIYANCLDMYKNASLYMEEILVYINGFFDKFEYNIISLESVTNGILGYIKNIDLTEFSKYAQGVINFTSGILNAFIAVVVSIYLLIDSERIINALKYVLKVFTSNEKAEKIFEYFKKINEIFSKYIYCKLIDAVVVGIISTIILVLINVKYAVFLGVFIGVLNLIPYFGSIISTVCVVLITLVTGGVQKAILTAILLLVLEQVDGNVIGPKILNNMLEIRPVWVIFAVTVFGNLFGVVGMLFSVPVFVVIKMMVKDFLREKEKSKVALENEK